MKIEDIMAYEGGELSDEDTIKMFQSGIDSGQVWRLQGSYGRMAQYLIDTGHCKVRDLHKVRAAAIFDVPYDSVTPEQRKYAKVINFSGTYGPT